MLICSNTVNIENSCAAWYFLVPLIFYFQDSLRNKNVKKNSSYSKQKSFIIIYTTVQRFRVNSFFFLFSPKTTEEQSQQGFNIIFRPETNPFQDLFSAAISMPFSGQQGQDLLSLQADSGTASCLSRKCNLSPSYCLTATLRVCVCVCSPRLNRDKRSLCSSESRLLVWHHLNLPHTWYSSLWQGSDQKNQWFDTLSPSLGLHVIVHVMIQPWTIKRVTSHLLDYLYY